MVQIRFLQTRVVRDAREGTTDEVRFAAGQVVDLPEASAEHWLSRGVAERVRVAEVPEPEQPGLALGDGDGDGDDNAEGDAA
jgi:hypothetical protein